MKKLSLFNRFIFVLNIVVAILLLVACAVPYISWEKMSFLAFLSLIVPFLVVTNFIFLLYWLIKRKRQLRLSLFVLVLGYFVLGTFVKFKFSQSPILSEDLSVMSYNVRVFNKYEELEDENIFDDIKSLVDKEQPDIICFQEVNYERQKEYEAYPHRFLHYIHNRSKTLLGIFSKYPIINAELIDFPNSRNSAAYADILYQNDTIRIYNTHLQSLGITHTKPSSVLNNGRSKRIALKLTEAFRKQQEQAKILKSHMESNSFRQILCGDFNNTQFSNAYQIVRGNKQDTFIEEGAGYGRTLNFRGLPVRIDFILADPTFEVRSHKNYDEKYSDHFPIMASFKLK